MHPVPTLQAFDAFLADRELRFDAVIIGASALALLDVIRRATDDCDVLDPQIPEPILRAAVEFASVEGIDADWLHRPRTHRRGAPRSVAIHRGVRGQRRVARGVLDTPCS